MREDALQRVRPLRDILNGLRDAAKIGCDWRSLPHDLPPWHAMYQQAVRWRQAGVFEAAAHGPCGRSLRLKEGKNATPSAAILDGWGLRSTSESGHHAGYGGAKRTKVHLAVDTLGCFLALHVTPADVDERKAMGELAMGIQEATGESVGLAWVDQGDTEEAAASAAREHGIELKVVKLDEAKRGSCRCPGAEWWSAPSRGPLTFAGSPRTTRVSPRPWRACTYSGSRLWEPG